MTIIRGIVCIHNVLYIVYYMCVTSGSPVSIARQRAPDEVMCFHDEGGGGGTKWREQERECEDENEHSTSYTEYMYMYTKYIQNDNTVSCLPLCLLAISSARAWFLPPARWATAATNSSQEGSPKQVVSYSLFSHSDRVLSKRLSTSVVLASILLRRSGCSLSALPTPLQLCATLRSS